MSSVSTPISKGKTVTENNGSTRAENGAAKVRYRTVWHPEFLTSETKNLDDMIAGLEKATHRLKEMRDAGLEMVPDDDFILDTNVEENYAGLVTYDPEVAKRFGITYREELDDQGRSKNRRIEDAAHFMFQDQVITYLGMAVRQFNSLQYENSHRRVHDNFDDAAADYAPTIRLILSRLEEEFEELYGGPDSEDLDEEEPKETAAESPAAAVN
jgi:hypothetical protein